MRPSASAWASYVASAGVKLRGAGYTAARLASAEATPYKLLPVLAEGRWAGSAAELCQLLDRGHAEEAARRCGCWWSPGS